VSTFYVGSELRDIEGYIEEVIDQNPNLDTANFFIESSYRIDISRTYPSYLLIKKGCDMVANEMTGTTIYSDICNTF